MAEYLEGTCLAVKFHNEQNGYTVMSVACGGEPITVVGNTPAVAVGAVIKAAGEYTVHASYGKQFSAETIEMQLPDRDHGDIAAFLAGGALRGVGEVTARRLVDAFGGEVLEKIAAGDEILLTVKGITKSRLHTMKEDYNRMVGVAKLIAELAGYQISAETAAVLYGKYGESAVKVLQADPFLLCTDEEIEMPFEEVDPMAKSMGVGDEDERRLSAAAEYVLSYNRKNGHTYAPRGALAKAVCNLTSVGAEKVEAALDRALSEEHLTAEEIDGVPCFFLPRYFQYESTVAKRLRELDEARPKKNSGVEKMIDEIEAKLGIGYADLQRRAIRDCLQNAVFILTGGPGTGKTTTLNGIIEAFCRMGLKIELCAPTGRAAKRMTEVTGRAASTVHRLLGMRRGSGSVPQFSHDQKNPIDCDALIVDESSMLDAQLAYFLVRAVRFGCRLVFVGDANQLPPVGAGNVLRDLIKSEMFSTVELTEIFRQARDSLIVVNAHSVLKGDPPELSQKDSDFFFLERDSRETAASAVAELASVRLPKNMKLDPFEDIQVICPTRKGEAGTEALNLLLQHAINPASNEKKEFTLLGKTFREGDKVMQTRNNYDMQYLKPDTGEVGMGIFNGDIGVIRGIDRLGERAEILFDDRLCSYPFECFADIDLAYAVTVHKAQGCEFRAVIMPVWFHSDKLQSRHLFYTAITRARETMILVGSREAILKMAANTRENRRYSALCHFLLKEG